MLAGQIPYPILIARYSPAKRLGYSAAADLVERGWYEPKWELEVKPAVRQLRSKAGAAPRKVGLPSIAEWLKSSNQTGWEDHRHVLRLIFDPTELTLAEEREDGV